MPARLRLISWSPEAAVHAKALRSAEFQVDATALDTSRLVSRIRDAAPAAVVIDLERRPSHGHAVASLLRSSKSAREIPIVFAGGDAEKVARLRAAMPDAPFASWKDAARAIRQAIARGPAQPVHVKSYMQQYAGSSLAKKLDLKAGMSVALMGEPEGFVDTLGEVTEGIEFVSPIGRLGNKRAALAMWFVRSGSELAAEVAFVSAGLPRDAALWIFFPKQSGRLRADFNQNGVRAAALRAGMVDYKICSVDADWSGLKFKKRKTKMAVNGRKSS